MKPFLLIIKTRFRVEVGRQVMIAPAVVQDAIGFVIVMLVVLGNLIKRVYELNDVKYNPNQHHRRSIRLKGYNYAASGAYFITICSHQRQCLFGDVVDGEIGLSQYGQIVAEEWLRSREIRQEIDFDAWVIMPNHLHGIVIINPPDVHPVGANGDSHVGANGRLPLQTHSTHQNRFIPPMKPRSLSSFVAGFKSATTKQINILRNTAGTPVWQRNYYEHIIRNDETLCQIRQYIHNNPMSWQEDQLHPDVPSKW